VYLGRLDRIAFLFWFYIERFILHHLYADIGKLFCNFRYVTVGKQLVFCQFLRGADIIRKKLFAKVGYGCPGEAFPILQFRVTCAESDDTVCRFQTFLFAEQRISTHRIS
jgi:hypothetical protein